MRTRPQIRATRGVLLVSALLALVLSSVQPAGSVLTPSVGAQGSDYFDRRTGFVTPTTDQLASVESLGATARWNRFGTPSSLIRHGAFLATGIKGDPATAARAFVSAYRGLFRLSEIGVRNLEVLNVSPMADSPGRAVFFRQRFGGLPAALDGTITVGITRGSVAYVSSSAAGDGSAPAPATLSPGEAWRRAAQDAGVEAGGAISNVRQESGWTKFDVAGLGSPQSARLAALPFPSGEVRAVYETIVSKPEALSPVGFLTYVDARSGEVLVRKDQVMELGGGPLMSHAINTGVFTGSTGDDTPGDDIPATAPDPENDCGGFHPIPAPGPNNPLDPGTQFITVTVTGIGPGSPPLPPGTVPLEDPVVYLWFVNDADTGGNDPDQVAFRQDLLTSPETFTYEVPDGNWGTYAAQVCEFSQVANFPYAGQWFTEQEGSAGGPESLLPYPPRWQALFDRAYPEFVEVATQSDPNPPVPSTDLRSIGCWEKRTPTPPEMMTAGDCVGAKELFNLASRVPWDYRPRSNAPTFTTLGNNAWTGEAWFSPLTPAEQYRPVDPRRRYFYPWTNQWAESRCSPTVFATPQRNDIDAAIVNLFAMHNWMHDWSYFLGFTERNYNAQEHNFGNSGAENDPEIGDAQAGALPPAGAYPGLLGRNNANQFVFPDGQATPTNMYLWQPFPGFYAPCVDGDFDMSVIAHEYAHLIADRMVGGPVGDLGAHQGRAQGEAYSDLNAGEFAIEHDLVPPGVNPYALGGYVTGNQVSGIRNYAIDNSPLNYSDIGYDSFGTAEEDPTSPHADSEIWGATNFDIRQALVDKYNPSFPVGDKDLQLRCSGTFVEDEDREPVHQCPGNRRWIQIMYDAWLLMTNPTMLDARDAYLAADIMRFGDPDGAGPLPDRPGPTNQAEMWLHFAKRGFGENASTASQVDPQPRANFESPMHPECTIKFSARAVDEGGAAIEGAQIYVGQYEGRVTPIADTNPATAQPGDTARFVGGVYEFVGRADGFGHHRFGRACGAGQAKEVTLFMASNWASVHKGATATGAEWNTGYPDPHQEASAGPPSQPELPAVYNLIDDTESTHASATDAEPIDQTRPAVTVDLAGDAPRVVRKVRVSALSVNEFRNFGIDEIGGRFKGVRQFAVMGCLEDLAATPPVDCDNPAATYTAHFTSGEKAFPGGMPRPLVHQSNLAVFDVPDFMATHVRFVALDNQCTGNTDYHDPDGNPAGPFTTADPDHDNDPTFSSDCRDPEPGGGTPVGELDPFLPDQDKEVRAAEFQVASAAGPTGGAVGGPRDPVVAFTMTAPPTATRGSRIEYRLTWRNFGPEAASNSRIRDVLPPGLAFVSGTRGVVYNSATRTVGWNLGTVPKGGTGTVTLTVRIKGDTPVGTVILNQAEFWGDLVVSTPAAWATVISG